LVLVWYWRQNEYAKQKPVNTAVKIGFFASWVKDFKGGCPIEGTAL